MTQATLSDVRYLRTHPDVVRVEVAPALEDGPEPFVTVGLWLREISDAEYEWVETVRRSWPSRRPERPADVEFSGEGEGHATFWDRCPGLETYRMIQEWDEGGWWAVKVWLGEPLSAVA